MHIQYHADGFQTSAVSTYVPGMVDVRPARFTFFSGPVAIRSVKWVKRGIDCTFLHGA